MNEHERYLVKLLGDALEGDLEEGIRKFEDYYWPPERDVLPWDTDLGRAIHDLASELKYFEPKAEWRTDPDLYDHDELRRRIREVLSLVAPD